MSPPQVGDTTTVTVSSAWWSKVNWTQAVAALSMILVFFIGPSAALTPEQQLAIVTVIGLVCNVATWIMKTWFTTTVHAASMTK